MPGIMFYLIGVAHRVQSKPKGAANTPQQKEFRELLTNNIKQLTPVLIGEEFSEYALRKLSKETGVEHESLTKQIADLSEVPHRFCDPDAEARKKMAYVEGSQLALELAMGDNQFSNAEINDRGFAIEVAKFWPRREQFWLQQLGDVLDKEVIFVFGEMHVESFGMLLRKSGDPFHGPCEAYRRHGSRRQILESNI
jgi:hypothetical protein